MNRLIELLMHILILSFYQSLAIKWILKNDTPPPTYHIFNIFRIKLKLWMYLRNALVGTL